MTVMENIKLPKTLKNNSLTFQNLNLIKESLLKVHKRDRTGNMEVLMKELDKILAEMSADDGSHIKVGDTVRANKSYHPRKYGSWYGELFEVIGIRPHKKLGIGYRIKCIDNPIFSQHPGFYVSRSAIVKV